MLLRRNFERNLVQQLRKFDLVVERLKKCAQTFINNNNYSSSTEWDILDELIFFKKL